MLLRSFFFLLGITTAFASGAPKEVPVVQTKTPLVIDGDPKDWPPTTIREIQSSDGRASVQFAADAGNFYAFVKIQDASPLKNGADRPEEMFKGGDTVAFYFRTDAGNAQRVAVSQIQGATMTYVYRPASKLKKPYVFSSPVGEARFDYVAPLPEARAVFKSEGKTGYVLEIALPWKALGLTNAPKAFDFDTQIVFSDPGGTQNAASIWLFAKEGPGLTIEDLPTEAKLYPDTWGKASLQENVKSENPTAQASSSVGMTIIQVQIPRKGRLSLNITDAEGWILRELVMAETVEAGKQTFEWDGRDRYGEPLPPGKYFWKALLFDGMRTEFMGSVGNSGRPPYRTEDGLGSMGGQHGTQKSVAQDEGGVYLANAVQEGPPVMRKIEPGTGKAIWMRSAGSFKGVAAVGAGENLACFINSLGKKEDYQFELVRIDPNNGNDVKMASGSARVRLEDAKGEKTKIGGLAIVRGKAWYSLPDQGQISVVDLTSGELGTPIKISQPQGLARLDDKTLLACSEDKLLALDVVTGAVKEILAGLVSPRAVCIDASGFYYIAELGDSQSIKKFSRDGKFVASWGKKGGKSDQQTPYDPMAFRNITGMVAGFNGDLWLAESDALVRRFVKLSTDGKWIEDIYGPVAYNTFGPDLDDFSTVYYNIGNETFIETKVNYDNYRKDPFKPYEAWKITSIHNLGLGADGQSVNERMRDVAATGYGHVVAFKAENGQRYLFRPSKHNRAAAPDGAGLWIEKEGRWIPCTYIDRSGNKNKSWSDANGDGLVQPEEEYEGLPPDGMAWMDRDFTLHGFAGKLPKDSITKSGAPLYRPSAKSSYLREGEKNYQSGWTFVSPSYDSGVYYIANHGPHRHLSFWDRATENRLIKVKDGKVQWIVGKHAPKPQFVELSTNSGISGMVDGVVLVQNIEPCNYVAYTEDGFVLGDIMVDAEGRHPKVGPYVINIESFTGLYLKDPKTNKNVLFAVSSGDDRILEITGPGKTEHFQGELTLSSSKPAGSSWEIPYSTWYGNIERGIGIDGEDTEWKPDVPMSSIQGGGRTVADIRMRRDAGALYLIANVLDESPKEDDGLRLVLSNQESGLELYSLDLTLKTDPKSGLQTVPSLTREGKKIESKGVQAKILPRWKNLGYRLEVEIPLSLLPELSAPRSQTFRRFIKSADKVAEITESRLDFKHPLFFGLELRGTGQGMEGKVNVPLKGVTLNP